MKKENCNLFLLSILDARLFLLWAIFAGQLLR
jgi:hypothetical protein